MANIENMSDAELNAALLAEMQEDNTAEIDSTINDDEETSQDEEALETLTADKEDITEELVEPKKEEKPKNKSNVAKILSEKNKLAQRVKELESMV